MIMITGVSKDELQRHQNTVDRIDVLLREARIYVHGANKECMTSLSRCPKQCIVTSDESKLSHRLDLDTALAWEMAKQFDYHRYRVRGNVNTLDLKSIHDEVHNLIAITHHFLNMLYEHRVKYDELYQLLCRMDVLITDYHSLVSGLHQKYEYSPQKEADEIQMYCHDENDELWHGCVDCADNCDGGCSGLTHAYMVNQVNEQYLSEHPDCFRVELPEVPSE